MYDSSLLATAATFLDLSLVEQTLARVDAWLEPATSFWQGKAFQRDEWLGFTRWVRITLTLGLALLLIYEYRARRLGEHIPERTKKIVAIVFTVLAFGVYFDFGNPNVRYADYYHRHEFFHYYLGSKYNQELGYHRIYECTAIAEIENGRGSSVRERELRDLRVNLIRPIKETYVVSDPAECKRHFTPERWDAFKKDVTWFYRSSAGSYWENMWKDHGYNPPPVWTMEGKILGSFGPASDPYFKVLSCVDVLFHLGSVLLLNWAFGWRAMAIATVFWGCNAPANFYWTGGAFIRQDWLFFLTAALCLAKKRMFVLAGAALTWSSLLRAFPLFLFSGWGLVMAFHALRRFRSHRAEVRWLQPSTYLHRDHLRLLAGCIVCAGILVPASIVATGGAKSYEGFVEHISVHKNTPLTNQMGLETILAHDWDGRMRFTRDDNLDDPFAGWKAGRTDRFEKMQPVFYAILAAVVLWMAWALRRTKLLWVAMPIGLPLAMGLTNLTCYYYSMYIVSVAIAVVRPQFAPAMLAVSGASYVLLDEYYFVDDRYNAQSWLWWLFSILILIAYSRPFSVARLRAWWEGKPEPKTAPVPALAPSTAGPAA